MSLFGVWNLMIEDYVQEEDLESDDVPKADLFYCAVAGNLKGSHFLKPAGRFFRSSTSLRAAKNWATMLCMALRCPESPCRRLVLGSNRQIQTLALSLNVCHCFVLLSKTIFFGD